MEILQVHFDLNEEYFTQRLKHHVNSEEPGYIYTQI